MKGKHGVFNHPDGTSYSTRETFQKRLKENTTSMNGCFRNQN